MSKTQKIVTMSLWAVLLLAMVGVVAGRFFLRHEQPAPPVLFPAATFSLTDQDNRPFSEQNLAGKPYLVAFIFTQCAEICPRMTSQMASLQTKLPSAVQMVSISVDPTRDTPAALKKYAGTYKADESRWHFLTGDRDKVIRTVQEMKLPFKEAEGDNPILHSERLMLIDGRNQVRGTYLSRNEQEMQKLLDDARYLADHPGEKGSE